VVESVTRTTKNEMGASYHPLSPTQTSPPTINLGRNPLNRFDEYVLLLFGPEYSHGVVGMAQIGPDRVALSAYTGAALRVSSRRRRAIGFSEDSPAAVFALCDRDSAGRGNAQSGRNSTWFGRRR